LPDQKQSLRYKIIIQFHFLFDIRSLEALNDFLCSCISLYLIKTLEKNNHI